MTSDQREFTAQSRSGGKWIKRIASPLPAGPIASAEAHQKRAGAAGTHRVQALRTSAAADERAGAKEVSASPHIPSRYVVGLLNTINTAEISKGSDLREAGETEERITAVASWQDAPYFTDAERVALELVEAVLTPNPFGERVHYELYAKASAHYDDKALWTLTLAIGQICFFIPVALIAKPIPGKAKHYSK